MMNKQILRSIASITKRVGGDLASPIIDKITPAETKTYTGEVIVAEGTMDSFSGDVIIEGLTLQNVMPEVNEENYVLRNGAEILNDTTFKLTTVGNTGHVFFGPKLDAISLLYNTKYTLYCEHEGFPNIDSFDYISYPNGTFGVISNYDRVSIYGNYVVAPVTVKDYIPDDSTLGFRCVAVPTGNGIAGSVVIKNNMCIHGDYTTKEHVKYFKGVHSLGENGKIYLKSSNKNLLPQSNNYKEGDVITSHPSEIDLSYKNGHCIVTKLANTMARHVMIGDSIYLKKDVKYYVVADIETSDNSPLCIAIRSNNEGTFIYKSEDTTNNIRKLEFVSNKTGYFSISFSTTNLAKDATATLKSCYFGTSPMGDDFIYHQENIIEIPVSEPVRSINSINVCDRIVKKGKKYFVERNVGRYDVNSLTTNDWQLHTAGGDTTTISFINSSLVGKVVEGLEVQKSYCVSSFLKGIGHGYIYRESELKEIGVSISESGKLYVRLLKNTVLNSDSLDGFKEFITNNPFFVLYPLKEPVYEEIDIEDIQVELYPEISIISAYDECVYANTTIDVPMNIMSIISNDIRKINSLEKEIEKAEKTVLTETMNLISIDEQFNNHIQKL